MHPNPPQAFPNGTVCYCKSQLHEPIGMLRGCSADAYLIHIPVIVKSSILPIVKLAHPVNTQIFAHIVRACVIG